MTCLLRGNTLILKLFNETLSMPSKVKFLIPFIKKKFQSKAFHKLSYCTYWNWRGKKKQFQEMFSSFFFSFLPSILSIFSCICRFWQSHREVDTHFSERRFEKYSRIVSGMLSEVISPPPPQKFYPWKKPGNAGYCGKAMQEGP